MKVPLAGREVSTELVVYSGKSFWAVSCCLSCWGIMLRAACHELAPDIPACPPGNYFCFCFVFNALNFSFLEIQVLWEKKTLFSFAETWYSQIFNTNGSPVSECTQCDSLPTPSGQGSRFSSACNHNAFRSKHWISRLSCSTSPDVLLCFILKETMKNKKQNKILLADNGRRRQCFPSDGPKCFLFCVCWSCSHFSTKRKGELK